MLKFASIAVILCFAMLPEAAGAQKASPAAKRSDIPIREVILSNGSRLYSVPIKVGGTEIEAGLDTGSSGLRILPGTLSVSDAKVRGPARAYIFTAGVQYAGDVVMGKLSLGGSSALVTLQAVRALTCLSNWPNCAATQNKPADYGIRGNNLTSGRFRAILGISNAPSDIGKPLPQLGVRRWIVELPRPGENVAGHLILNPKDNEVKDFVRLANFAARPNSPLRDAVNGCLVENVSAAEICGAVLLDTGAPGLRIVSTIADPKSWRIGDTAVLEFGDVRHARAVENLVLGMRGQSTLMNFVRGRPIVPGIFAGNVPYFAFDVLYDPANGQIGVRPRPQARGGPISSLGPQK